MSIGSTLFLCSFLPLWNAGYALATLRSSLKKTFLGASILKTWLDFPSVYSRVKLPCLMSFMKFQKMKPFKRTWLFGDVVFHPRLKQGIFAVFVLAPLFSDSLKIRVLAFWAFVPILTLQFAFVCFGVLASSAAASLFSAFSPTVLGWNPRSRKSRKSTFLKWKQNRRSNPIKENSNQVTVRQYRNSSFFRMIRNMEILNMILYLGQASSTERKIWILKILLKMSLV